MAVAPIHQYLPRLVREWDVEAPGQLHQAIDGSMVFVDVSGFTKMSERLARHGKLGAEEVTEVIGGTFERLLGEAYGYGASLLKFGGDALLLFFQGERHCLRAAAAAGAMRKSLRDLGRLKTSAGLVSLRMSVGVHSGSFDFFLVGDSHRELIVAGPAATATTAMESAASAGQILLSPAAAGLLPERNVGKALGPGFLLKGHVEADKTEFEPAQPKPEMEQFLARGLREPLLSGDVEPEHRPIAIGFIHFMDFDNLIATSGYDRAAQALDRLVRTVQAATDSRGVTFLASDIAPDGGKIILTAGVPQATGNDEEQMLLALREIVSVDQDLPVQVGVNWGPVFVGEIGPRYRRTYTVMGDTVNLAARLMAKAPVREVLATRELLEGSRTLFETKELEPFLVKGKKLPIQAFAVGDPTGTRGASDIASPLVGRDRELEVLTTSWESAVASRGRLVELVADPGMGKTRLLQEFLLRSGDSRTIRAECRLYQAATPYFPFRALLRQALEVEGLDPNELIEKVETRVKEVAPALIPWLALIGVAMNVEIPPSPEVVQLDDQFRPARTLAAVGALLEAVITAPTLIVIEDTHWMDDSSRELLAGLLFGLERQPWMFLLTRRPSEGGFISPESSQAASIELMPLTQTQAEDFINSATSDHPLLPSQVTALAERAAGNPLFLVELLRSLKSGSDVDSLPHSVEGLIAARIDRLRPSDRQLLRRLAVLGNGFLVEHTGAVIPDVEPGARVRVIRRLDDFVSLNHNGWVQFRHVLIRDVAYEALPFKNRSELHRRVGDSIRSAAGDDPDSQAELLSLHYFHAQNWTDAWHFSRVAGDNAKYKYANIEAARFYERALESARRLPFVSGQDRVAVFTALGDVRESSGSFRAAFEAYRKATALVAEDRVLRADLHLKRGRVREREGAYRRALSEITAGHRLLDAMQDPGADAARARLSAFAAAVRVAQQQDALAIKQALRAVEEALAANEKAALARAYSVLDIAYQWTGQAEKAVYSKDALALYEELRDLSGQATVISNQGVAAYFDGRWNEAAELYIRSRDLYLSAGNEVAAADRDANLGELLINQGYLDRADEVLRNAIRVLKASGFIDGAAFCEVQIARVMMEKGEYQPAESLLRKALATFTELGETPSALDASVHLAECLMRQDRCSEALDLLDSASSTVSSESTVSAPAIMRMRSLALTRLGRPDEAWTAANSALALAKKQRLPYELALTLLAGSDLQQIPETLDTGMSKEAATEILTGLGVVRTPRPVSP